MTMKQEPSHVAYLVPLAGVEKPLMKLSNASKMGVSHFLFPVFVANLK